MKTTFSFFFLSFFIISCSHWTEDDTELFMEQCERSKFEKKYCNCALVKVKSKFNSFNEIAENEEIMVDLLIDCLDTESKVNNTKSTKDTLKDFKKN